MNQTQADNPKQACERILIEEKRYNVEHRILPSEIAVVDRMLARSIELADAYGELHSKLHQHAGALRAFLALVLNTAAFWNPEKISEARRARDDLAEVNRQIARKAAELACLLQQRSGLHNTSSFSSGTHYHVCDVIAAAAKDNSLFQGYVQARFEALHTQFDLKYWPTLSEVLQELATDADTADQEASDPLTEAATAATRSSLADFFRALFAAIDENLAYHYNQLPLGFSVTDNTLASLANCALDLSPDDMVDGPYVKRLRQRSRERAK